LLNGTNGIDCAKDVPLEFGDVVEIPERDHSLAESAVGLTISQWDSKANCLKGTVQLAVRDQKVELPITPAGFRSIIGNVISQPDVRKLLSSSSDLSRVKVSRHDAKTGEKHEWILDCSNQPSVNPMPPGYVPPRFDLRLRDGDVVEVPEKP